MARGIIVKRPGGGSPNGRMVTTEVISDPNGRMPSILPGKILEYPPNNTPEIGDVVEFVYDPATGYGDRLNTVTKAIIYTGESAQDLDIPKGQYVLLNAAKIEGGITVSGGVLAIANASSFSGKISGVTADSTIIINGSSTEGKVESNNNGFLTMDTVNSLGKVTSTSNAITTVQNCVISGKLEVLGAAQCFLANNTVQGQTNTDCK